MSRQSKGVMDPDSLRQICRDLSVGVLAGGALMLLKKRWAIWSACAVALVGALLFSGVISLPRFAATWQPAHSLIAALLGIAFVIWYEEFSPFTGQPKLFARMATVAMMTGEDGGNLTDIEIKMKPGRRPVEVRWLRLEWHDGAEPYPDEILAANGQAPTEPQAPFLLERAGARRVAFSISPPWRSRGKGRVVAMVGTEEVASDWFPMLAPRH